MKLLVRKVHFELAHYGWSYVLAKFQNCFWILHGQSAVRSYLKNCVFCQLRSVESSKDRLVSGICAFFTTGCDMFGPFFVTILRKRLNRWCCIFVCFCTHVVHLELCFDMSCDSFLNAFFRFFNSTVMLHAIYGAIMGLILRRVLKL